MEKFRELLKEYNEKKKMLFAEFSRTFTTTVAEMFIEGVDTISFPMYTMYFNDGEECTFYVYFDNVEINRESMYDRDFQQEEDDMISKIGKIVEEIPEEFFKDVFGDHILLTIYRDGEFSTSHYSHD
jgi:hypothetical protein